MMFHIRRFSLLVLSLLVGVLIVGLSTNTALAQDNTPREGVACPVQSSTFLGLPSWYKYLDGEYDTTRFTEGGNPVCSPVVSTFDAILPIGLAILEGLLRLSGVVAVVMIFWASFKFLTSQGNGEAAAEARRTAINALIGLVIVIIATSLISFVGNRLADSSPVTSSQKDSTIDLYA